MLTNVICTIKKFTGTSSNRTLVTLATELRLLLVPVSNEILMLHPDLPVGSSFSFTLLDDGITIPPESEIDVTGAEQSGFTTSDKFTVRDTVKKERVMGRMLHNGICVKIHA